MQLLTHWKRLLGGLVALLLITALTLAWQWRIIAVGPVYATGGVAINGYDPVAYFDENRPVAGRAELAYEHDGVTWLFSSERRRDRFSADPARYLPQFGGYCAYAVGSGYSARSDPAAFSIVDDKLYLNFDLATRDAWIQNAAALIEAGERNWPGVLLGH